MGQANAALGASLNGGQTKKPSRAQADGSSVDGALALPDSSAEVDLPDSKLLRSISERNVMAAERWNAANQARAMSRSSSTKEFVGAVRRPEPRFGTLRPLTESAEAEIEAHVAAGDASSGSGSRSGNGAGSKGDASGTGQAVEDANGRPLSASTKGLDNKYASKEVLRLWSIFCQYDVDDSGTISVEELQEVEAAINAGSDGRQSQDARTADMFATVDRDTTGSISFKDLLRAFYPLASRSEIKAMISALPKPESSSDEEEIELTDDEVAQIEALFITFDDDESGTVTADELHTALLNANFTHEEVEELFAKFDNDGNREVDIEEFTVAMKPIFTAMR